MGETFALYPILTLISVGAEPDSFTFASPSSTRAYLRSCRRSVWEALLGLLSSGSTLLPADAVAASSPHSFHASLVRHSATSGLSQPTDHRRASDDDTDAKGIMGGCNSDEVPGMTKSGNPGTLLPHHVPWLWSCNSIFRMCHFTGGVCSSNDLRD